MMLGLCLLHSKLYIPSGSSPGGFDLEEEQASEVVIVEKMIKSNTKQGRVILTFFADRFITFDNKNLLYLFLK